MAEYLMRYMIENEKSAGRLSGEYTVISRALSNAYEPEDSPASAQGVSVCRIFLIFECLFI